MLLAAGRGTDAGMDCATAEGTAIHPAAASPANWTNSRLLVFRSMVAP
jgi:hypothetical protein